MIATRPLRSLALVAALALVPFACATGVTVANSDASVAASVGVGGTGGTGGAGGATGGVGGLDCGMLEPCKDACVDLAHDPENCGACGKKCAPATGKVAVCIEGACESICAKGMASCDGNEANGCETPLATDIGNCGKCLAVCPPIVHGFASCKDGKCGLGTCDPGFADCDGDALTGCETNTNASPKHCGKCGTVCDPGLACVSGTCGKAPTNFVILEKQDTVYQGIAYVALKVGFASSFSASADWCQDYTNLCLGVGASPTGCGDQYNFDAYGTCKSKYLSDGVSNTLGCNPSGGVAAAAQQVGWFDANGGNSFGFHYCDPGSCSNELCYGGYCNSALSYVDASLSYAYTLCKK